MGDYKVDVLDLADKDSRTSRIRASLRALGSALVSGGKALDAVVVSGDVTSRNEQAGLALLPLVLAELGGALPSPDKILVVPGNHDVAWGTNSSSPERYANFLKLREFGYLTAFLDGVDIDVNGNQITADEAPKAPLIAAADGTFIVVGLNSSNHCGVHTKVEPSLQAHVNQLRDAAKNDEGIDQLLRAWSARGLYDMARVDRGQLRAVSETLTKNSPGLEAPGEPVRIAALHHQLLPVSASEEVKPFESLTNLAAVRDWLAGNEIDIVLHGHKHQGHVIEDVFVPQDNGAKTGSHSLLIVSAPTIGHGAPTTDPVGRLLEFTGPASRQYPAKIANVPSVNDGVPIDLNGLTWDNHLLGGDDHLRTGVIRQRTAQQVHARLMALRDRFNDLPSPLICKFTDGASALKIPADYPDLPVDATEGQQWFTETVDWWQADKSGQSVPFNHGERLRSFGQSDLNQAVKAVDSLFRDTETSRAVAVLLDPHHDLANQAVQFPAFVLVQFTLRNSYLDVLGYFRKQEMPHWWPINAAELASLQEWVVGELVAKGKSIGAGAVTTVTALPVAGRSVPRVAVPFLEREMERTGGLLRLVLPLVLPPKDPEDLKSARKLWTRAMEDWKPGAELAADGDPVPVKSLRELSDIIGQVSRHAVHSAELTNLQGLLSHLSSINENYSVRQQQSDRKARHETWRQQAVPLIDRLVTQVDSILKDAGTQ